LGEIIRPHDHEGKNDKRLNSVRIRTEDEEAMKPMRVSDGIVPIGENEPLLITQNGSPAGVLISPTDFDRLQERQRFLESVAAGVADAEAGRLMDTRQLSRKLTEARRSRGAG
jgi:hypothetical protein